MDRRLLDDQFQQDEHEFGVFSRYLVLILTIDKPIGKDKFHSNRRRVSPTGQRAITHILSSKMVKEGVCELELKLDTGRTHHIMDRRLLDDQFQQDEHEFGVFARYLVLILIHKHLL